MPCGASGMYFWHFYHFENFGVFWASKWSFAPKFRKIILTIYRLIKYETKKTRNYPQRKGRYKAKSKFCFMSITMDAGSETVFFFTREHIRGSPKARSDVVRCTIEWNVHFSSLRRALQGQFLTTCLNSTCSGRWRSCSQPWCYEMEHL